MKYLLIMIIAFSANAGFKETKAFYEQKLKALRVKYVINLKAERVRAVRFGKSVSEIDKEIVRIENLLDPMPDNKSFQVTYSTGIRNYDIVSKTNIYFKEGRQSIPYVRKGNILIINHIKGAVETWEGRPDGTYKVLFVTPDNKNIFGNAKPVK